MFRKRVCVVSAKGGVGKSTASAFLAKAFALRYPNKVGLLDADIHGPSIPKLLGTQEAKIEYKGEYIKPITVGGLKVMSLGYFMPERVANLWAGAEVHIVKAPDGKEKAIAVSKEQDALWQCVYTVDWGDLDYFIIDYPPGCLPAGTLVLTANNVPRPIEKIEVGEFVLASDGNKLVPRRVNAVVPQGFQNVFQLKTPNRTITASGNHPFLKYTRQGFKWTRLDQLKPHDRIGVVGCLQGGLPLPLPDVESNITRKDSIKLPTHTTPGFMRIIGHFVGDGFIKKDCQPDDRSYYAIRVCEPKGGKFRDQYVRLYEGVLGATVYDDNGGLKFGVSSTPLSRLFIALDLHHKALEKIVPSWVFSLPLEQRRAFLQGYAEADGSIRHREREFVAPDYKGNLRSVQITHDICTICTPNLKLVEQLHELCLMSGYWADNIRQRKAKTTIISGRIINGKTAYEFDYSLKERDNPFVLSHIRSIEPMGVVPTYDLQVEQYHNFVANMMLVHNSGDEWTAVMNILKPNGAVVVTTPRVLDTIVIKTISALRLLNVPIIGTVENFAGFRCPCGCNKTYFAGDGGSKVAEAEGLKQLAKVPQDLEYPKAMEEAMIRVAERIQTFFEEQEETMKVKKEEKKS